MFDLYKSWLRVYLDKYHENAEYEMRRQRELKGTDQLGDEKFDKMIEASGGKKGPERIKRLRRQARYGNHPVTRERWEEGYKKYVDEGNKTGVWYSKEADDAKQAADIKRYWASKKSYVNKYDEEEHELRRQREHGDNTKFTDRELELIKNRKSRYGTSKITNMRHEEEHEKYLKAGKWWKKPTLSADNPKFKLTRDEQQQMGRKTGGTMLDYLHQQKEREEKKKPKPSGGFVIDEDDPDDVSNKSLYKSWLEKRWKGGKLIVYDTSYDAKGAKEAKNNRKNQKKRVRQGEITEKERKADANKSLYKSWLELKKDKELSDAEWEKQKKINAKEREKQMKKLKEEYKKIEEREEKEAGEHTCPTCGHDDREDVDEVPADEFDEGYDEGY